MSNKPNLIICNNFHSDTVAALDKAYVSHHLWKLDQADREQLIHSLDGKCTAVATASWLCDPMIYQLDSLEFVACFGVGVDGVDFSEIGRLGAKVSNTPDVLDDAVADTALALILATTRNLVNADAYVRGNTWQQQGSFPFGDGIQGKTLGILGLGRIGSAIAHRATSFGLRIAYHNRNRKESPYRYCASVDELATRSDILLCILPGGQETKHMINSEVLQKLGPNGYFINVGRGSSVDEEALAAALDSRSIAGAGLDVYENEPCVHKSLLAQPNVVLLPHIGSATVETRQAMGQLVIENLAAYFSNQPLISEYQYQ